LRAEHRELFPLLDFFVVGIPTSFMKNIHTCMSTCIYTQL